MYNLCINSLSPNKKFNKNFLTYFVIIVIFLFSSPFLAYFALTTFLKLKIYPDLNIVLHSEGVEALENSWVPKLGVWYLDVVTEFYDRQLNKDFLLPDYDPMQDIQLYDISENPAIFKLLSVNKSDGTVQLEFQTPLEFVGDIVNPKIDCNVASTKAGEVYTSTQINLGDGGKVIYDNSNDEDVTDENFERVFELNFDEESSEETDSIFGNDEDDFILEIRSGFDKSFEITSSVIDFLDELMQRSDITGGFANVTVETICPDYECTKTGTECVINVMPEKL